MSHVTFIDIETDLKGKRINDLGAISDDGRKFHSSNMSGFLDFIKEAEYLCGHNILRHDLNVISQTIKQDLSRYKIIDTLPLSPLLFPNRTIHRLVKDDKLQTEELNNPVNDAQKTKELLDEEVAIFTNMPQWYQSMMCQLLKYQPEFQGFFSFLKINEPLEGLPELIRKNYQLLICEQAPINQLIDLNPISLAYSLAILYANKEVEGSSFSITPPWVRKNYPDVDRVLFLLRNNPCFEECSYCSKALDAHVGLARYFSFPDFRKFEGRPLQEEAVKEAINGKSFLVVFPTGGGKSLTFQLPALMAGDNVQGLTVVISPLQSLMKDQVDNLEKLGHNQAVTINGMLDPIERKKSIEQVLDGSASLLYISPEALRQATIQKLLQSRNIVRFVIDEAHCFSSWGQDFRVDYLYIGDFIQNLQKVKGMSEGIPVSCFTATAKQKVIEDIRSYFKEKLELNLNTFKVASRRQNLHYKVLNRETEEDKYATIRELIEVKDCPSIVYVSRTGKATKLAEKLQEDGHQARAFHGRMNSKEKIENQDSFIKGSTQIMVATSAFGMGVDKKNVGMVIHYDISDSLENYIQEAGRAGRDEGIEAECFVLFKEDDLDKHFLLLNQTKINIKEIQQIWSAIIRMTQTRDLVSRSALEIARQAGWDENVSEIETRVKTAVTALEDAGYIKRNLNSPMVFATGILVKNAQEAIDKIEGSAVFKDSEKQEAIRIIKALISAKTRGWQDPNDAESRIDYIADRLGIQQLTALSIVNRLVEEKILADTKDMTAFIRENEKKNRSREVLLSYGKLEKMLLTHLQEGEKAYSLKSLNHGAEEEGIEDSSIRKFKTILSIWSTSKWVSKRFDLRAKDKVRIKPLHSIPILDEKLSTRHQLAQFVVDFLFARRDRREPARGQNKDLVLVQFSIHEIREAYLKENTLFKGDVELSDIEDALFYLSKIEAMTIDGGFLVLYNKLQIERLEKNNRVKYKTADYEKLDEFYKNKTSQIHIVGEYAKKMVSDYEGALQFVDDYFQLNYASFLQKYFNRSQQKEIERSITTKKFKQVFGELSASQLKIIKDNESQYIVVAAGPGSGKTKLLVHKLASLLLTEDVKHEQLLMLTFSRSAVTEFKVRLRQLIKNAAHFVQINTFHSYCFDLLGKMGDLKSSETVISTAVEKIRNNEIEQSQITKTVLVIDESQDMDQHEFDLVQLLMERNDGMRVIAVGDDDQNIYEFRGSSSEYLERLITKYQAQKYELPENFRSKNNLVEFTNRFAERISKRLKTLPVNAVHRENGEVGITQYDTDDFIMSVIEAISTTDLAGTVGVLTNYNSDAVLIAGLLRKRGFPARLIQNTDSFNLFDLKESRILIELLDSSAFSAYIPEEAWSDIRRILKTKLEKSDNLELLDRILDVFTLNFPKKKYRSDLEEFLRTSRSEDFVHGEGETILVSTIHKAKGKEFENVFLLLKNFQPAADDKKRVLYVGMTRAKTNLQIHYKDRYLEGLEVEQLRYIKDQDIRSVPDDLYLMLSLRDIYLGGFRHIQGSIQKLNSGDQLKVDENGCYLDNGRCVIPFSNKFKDEIQDYSSKGYKPNKARINFIVYWYNEEYDQEYLVALPEVRFGRVV